MQRCSISNLLLNNLYKCYNLYNLLFECFDRATLYHLGAGLPATRADLLSLTGLEIIALQADKVARTARAAYVLLTQSYGSTAPQLDSELPELARSIRLVICAYTKKVWLRCPYDAEQLQFVCAHYRAVEFSELAIAPKPPQETGCLQKQKLVYSLGTALPLWHLTYARATALDYLNAAGVQPVVDASARRIDNAQKASTAPKY